MKIVVIGGSGLIGTKVVKKLRAQGHDVVAASPSSGVDTLTGTGLREALTGATVVVDVANSPSFEDKAVMHFFETSARNVVAAELAAGVKHHVVLSVVGADRLTDIGYMRAKVVQENTIRSAGIAFTIVRATQFFEFLGAIADASTEGDTVRLPSALMQPLAAEDVAEALAEIALQAPANGVIEVAGPESQGMDEFAHRVLRARGDVRKVVGDKHALYFGGELTDRSLRPEDNARIAPTSLEDWLALATAAK